MNSLNKRIMLIQPPFERIMGYSRYYSHPGLLSLAAVIEAAGHEVLIYDADYNPDGSSYTPYEMLENYNRYIHGLENPDLAIWREIKDTISEFNPQYIGLTVLSPTFSSALKVIEISKKTIPGIQVIVGGTHATLCPDNFLGVADYIVQYEGEELILDILAGNLPKGVIAAKRIQDLDSLPFPAVHLLHGINKYKKRDLSMVVSSRGCPYDCKFCNSSQIWHKEVSRKSVARFIQEIEFLRERYGIHDFFISDDSFTYNKKWLSNFCNQIKKMGVTWRCLARMDNIDEETIGIMKEANCRNVKFGIESGSQRILDQINKRINTGHVLKVSEMLKNKDMNWSAFFMVGFPGETEEDITMTKDLIKRITARSITLSIYTPFPCDRLYNGFKFDYKLYSHHSPNNNFTGTIDNMRFKQLVYELLNLSYKGYEEHTDIEKVGLLK